MHHNQHFKKRTAALEPLPQRTLCTLLKMMTILDDSLPAEYVSSITPLHVCGWPRSGRKHRAALADANAHWENKFISSPMRQTSHNIAMATGRNALADNSFNTMWWCTRPAKQEHSWTGNDTLFANNLIAAKSTGTGSRRI